MNRAALAAAVVGYYLIATIAPTSAQQMATLSVRARVEAGKRSYQMYCAGCHGDKGDGKGPAAIFLDPKPRDFISGKFKFASVPSGQLPRDEDLHRTITKGLSGTSMPAWPLVPETERLALIAYLKTFSARWSTDKPGAPITVPADPFKDNAEAIGQAIHRGENVYHTLTTCWQCHPGYVTPQKMEIMMKDAGRAFAGVRPDWQKPVLKDDGWGQPLMPTDFLTDRIKTGLDMNNLFVVIAAGIGGTAMPTWKDSIPDEDLWALSYYVRSLADQRNALYANLPLAPPPDVAKMIEDALPALTPPPPAAEPPKPETKGVSEYE